MLNSNIKKVLLSCAICSTVLVSNAFAADFFYLGLKISAPVTELNIGDASGIGKYGPSQKVDIKGPVSAASVAVRDTYTITFIEPKATAIKLNDGTSSSGWTLVGKMGAKSDVIGAVVNSLVWYSTAGDARNQINFIDAKGSCSLAANSKQVDLSDQSTDCKVQIEGAELATLSVGEGHYATTTVDNVYGEFFQQVFYSVAHN